MGVDHPGPSRAKTQQGRGYTLELLVSADLLTAQVRLQRAQRASACTAADIVAFVHSAGLSLGKADQEQLQARAEKLVSGPDTGTETVCHGVAAKPWPPVEWFVPLGAQQRSHEHERKAVDLHQVTKFANAHAGQKLCALPAAPAAGHDVYGHALPVPPAPVQPGRNVAGDPVDPRVVVAQIDGCARLVDGVLSVEYLLDVKGDLDFKVGNIDFWGAVVIHGNVLDDFQVKATKNIVVEGSLGMASLQAGGDIDVKGGVNGGRKARLLAGGSVHVHFLHGAHVEAAKDVSVDVECLDSVVHAGGDVKVVRGGIIGGEVRAKGNIEAAAIGSELCVPTAVAAGHTGGGGAGAASQRANVDEADEQVAQFVAELAKTAGSGGVKGKPLTELQKERLASLHRHLDEAKAKAHHARRELAEFARQHGHGTAVIKASKGVFPRVAVGVGGVYHLDVKTELKGGVTFSADHEKAGIKVEGRKATDEPIEHAVSVEDPAARWRWGGPVLLAGLVVSLMLSWTPGSRLLSVAGPLKVASCEVVDDYAGSARSQVKDAKGATLVLGWEELRAPQECVAEGTLVEKRRWSFDYDYNGVPFAWPKGATRYLGPLLALLSVLAWAVAFAGRRLAEKGAVAPPKK
jgi:hypothetical protein